MEDLITLMKTRRSIRKFKPELVPLSEIKKTLEAARWAPSAGNSQPWQFVVVQNKDIISAIKMFSPGIVFDQPPALVVLCQNHSRFIVTQNPIHMIDVGTSLQNLLLMAHSLGLGCTPIFSFDKDAIASILSIPADVKPVLLIEMGYPNEHVSLRSRISLDDLIQKIVE